MCRGVQSRPQNVPALPAQTHCGTARGQRQLRPEARHGCRRSDHAGDRGGDWRGYLLVHRDCRGGRGPPLGRGRAVRSRPGARCLLRPAGRGLWACGALLRGARRDDPAGGERLRVPVRHAGGADRVDHRVGFDPGVRGRQHCGRDRVERLFHVAAQRVWHPSAGLPDSRLPDGAPQFRPGDPRPPAERPAGRGRAASPERSRLHDRHADYVACSTSV